MARRDPGSPQAQLPDDFVAATPRFDEKLLFVFELVPVTPLVVAPMVTPPGQVIPPPTEWQLATKSPELPLPGAIKPGQGVLPKFIGQGSPIKLEGHNITHLSLDMLTHGFTGSMRFRVSDTRLLGDVTDKDRVAKLFSGDDLLMVKLVIRPKVADQEFPQAMTPVLVPQVVGAVPVPVVPPTPPPIQVPLVPTIPPVPVVPPPPPAPPVAALPPPPPPSLTAAPPPLPVSVPTIPVIPAVPGATPTEDSPLGPLMQLASSPAVQAVLSSAAEAGVLAIVASNPQLAPVFIALGVAAQAGLIPPPAAGPATAAASELLSAQPQLAAGMAVLGMAAEAGALPPEVAPFAAAAGQLAIQSSPELQAISTVAAQTGLAPSPPPPTGTAPSTVGGNAPTAGPPPSPFASFAQLATESDLLPPAVASALATSPSQALSAEPLGSLMSLLNQVGPLAAKLSPTALPSTGLPQQQPVPNSPLAGQPVTVPPNAPPVPPLPSAVPVPVPPPVPPPLPTGILPPPRPLVQPIVPHVLPPKLQPIYQPQPELVGAPTLYEQGISPRSLQIPIELTVTAVITERTIIEHTSYNADEVLVSIREYSIRFADPAQALWRRHFPIALYTQTTLRAVVEDHCNPLINVKVSGPGPAVEKEQIFVACDADQSDRERACFYDWLMWRLSEMKHEWLYDYSQNLYQIVARPPKPEPFTIYAADVADIVTHHIEGRFYCETLMNDYTASVSRDPILNLQTLQPLRQDRLHHSQVPILYEAEFLDRMGSFEQPQADFILQFKRFPSRPFPPGVGVDFKLDPIDFPSHHFLLPKAAKGASRVYRLKLELESHETDVLPRMVGYSGGMYRCAVAAQLQSGKDKAPRLPSFVTPHYPIDLEGLIHTDTGLPGEQPYQTFTDVTGLMSLRAAIPLFANQLVKIPFEPFYQTGHFYFPPYRAERVLVSLFCERSEFKRFLNWRPGGLLPSLTQGNQIRMGRDMMNGAVMRLLYASDIPTYLVQRQRYSSNQTMTMYQSGIDLRTVELPPNVDVKAQKVVVAAGAAVELASGAKDLGAMVGKAAGGGKLPKGAPKALQRAHLAQPKLQAQATPQVTSGRLSKAQGELAQAGQSRAGVRTVARGDRRNPPGRGAAVAEAAPPRRSALELRGRSRSPVTPAAKEQGLTFAQAFPTLGVLPAGPTAKATSGRARGGAPRTHAEPAGRSSLADNPRQADLPQPKRLRPHAAALPGMAGSEGYALPAGFLSGVAGGAGEYTAALAGSTAEGVTSLLAAAAGSAMSAALNLDSNLGVTLQYTPLPAKAVQVLRMDAKKNALMSLVDTKASLIEQAGDTVTITCKDFIVNAANIQLNSALSTTVQSLGTVSILSKLSMLLRSVATLDISAVGAATLQAASIAIDALTTLAQQGQTGVSVLGNGSGVQLFGSQVSATGMTTSIVGQTTNVLGTQVAMGLPAPVGPPSAIPGLTGGELASLAARLAAPGPIASPAAVISELASEISTLISALPISEAP